MEGGLDDSQRETLGVRQNQAYAVYDGERQKKVNGVPKGILYQQDYHVRGQAESV